MTSKQKREAASDELLRHYKPLAIKAVLAGCTVKREPWQPKQVATEVLGQLPEGFHLPEGLEGE